MHEFRYKNDTLYCEDVAVEAVARKAGTPVYLYSYATLVSHFRKLRDAFKPVSPLICFSMKANSNLAVCRSLVREGAGLDVVSGGELYRALKVGVNPKKIVYASVGKTEKEIKNAIEAGILLFNVESAAELELIEDISAGLRRKTQVSLRINPDISAHTHKYITTGKAINKFGIDLTKAESLFRDAGRYPHLQLRAVHIHIGSQITEAQPFVRAIKIALKFVSRLKRSGIRIEWLNIGGGLGIIYSKERPQTARDFARAVLPLLKKSRLKIILEPGRFIAGNSGILVTKVTYVKETPANKFIVVDAGMNDLIRPALYGSYHEILPVRADYFMMPRLWAKADVVGPICETADFFAKNRRLPPVESGELLAVFGAGAYGFTMSSNYNSRPRPAEVLVIKDRFYIVTRRQSYSDLVRGETIPKCLR